MSDGMRKMVDAVTGDVMLVPCPHPFDAVSWNPYNEVIQCHRCGHGLLDGAVERMAGRLSGEPPYSSEHPEARVPLARDLLAAAWETR